MTDPRCLHPSPQQHHYSTLLTYTHTHTCRVAGATHLAAATDTHPCRGGSTSCLFFFPPTKLKLAAPSRACFRLLRCEIHSRTKDTRTPLRHTELIPSSCTQTYANLRCRTAALWPTSSPVVVVVIRKQSDERLLSRVHESM